MFDLCLPQNQETNKYLKKLGAKKIKLIGNLKLCDVNENSSDFFYLSEKILSEENLSDTQKLLWSPRIQRIGSEYINYNFKNKENIKQVFTEIEGQIKLKLNSNYAKTLSRFQIWEVK